MLFYLYLKQLYQKIFLTKIFYEILQHSFMVGSENSRGVCCMVSAGHGVWVAMHNSAVIRLYHGVSHDCLCELNVAPAVSKMLAGQLFL